MTMIIGTSGGNKTVAAITIGTSGGNKAVQVGYIGTSSGNKVFFSALSVVASPNPVTGTGSTISITTNACTATPTGGIGPYTYLWTKVSGDSITINSPTSATTTFTGGVMASPEERTAIFICTVTDTGTGISAQSNSITATVDRT